MPHSVRGSIVINRPPEEVFDYLVNIEKSPQWSATLTQAVHEQGGGKLKPRSRVRETRNLLGKKMESTYEVVKLERPKIFATKVVDGPVEFDFNWSLEPDANGTRLTGEGTGAWNGEHEDDIVARVVDRQLHHDMQTLKDLLELHEARQPA
jgi:uncharacterized protein YndB with AHSA1/START domain